ncbi:MAG TPA: hypothetical protein V6D35_06635 [Candidatus Sericytochromatia bacterium]
MAEVTHTSKKSDRSCNGLVSGYDPKCDRPLENNTARATFDEDI